MTDASEKYLLAGGAAELERLQLQARVWEPEAETMLDHIGLEAGWHCLDLGCGAMGILGPLARRVGPSGQVVASTSIRCSSAGRAHSSLITDWPTSRSSKPTPTRPRFPTVRSTWLMFPSSSHRWV